MAGYTTTSANANVNGSQNTYIGYNSGPGTAVQYSNSMALGANTTVSANNATEIGTSSVLFCGINGAAYNSAYAFAVGTAAGGNGNAAYCTVGGVWTNTSDRNKKENFSIPDGEKILDKVCTLPIFRWNYKTEPATVQHIGPMAQDFYKIFNVGNDSLSISTIDPAGIALVAVKELNAKLEKQNQSIQYMQQVIDSLRTANTKLLDANTAMLKHQTDYDTRLKKLEELSGSVTAKN